MKIKSLILGSVAAVGLSTGAMAADLGTVLTNLDVCDALNISGLTISSDTNCLSITGNVAYSLNWGDYSTTVNHAGNSFFGVGHTSRPIADGLLDWDSSVDAWLQFAASADSSFGTAMAVLRIGYDNDYTVVNQTFSTSMSALVVDQAYVSVGDSTVLMAGQKGTIANFDNDEPFNYLGLFNSSWVDTGVGFGPLAGSSLGTGGQVIQVTSDLGDGVSVAAGLENINSGTAADDGTLVGVLAYAGDSVDANITMLAGGILDGVIENWGVQAGITVDLDMFRIRGAVAADTTGYWNVLGSAEAEFDMFTLAISGEAAAGGFVGIQAGIGGSISAEVTDTVTINLGARWWDDDLGTVAGVWESGEVRAQLIAAVTETVTLTGEVGVIADTTTPAGVVYFGGDIAWAPGGGFETSIGATANSAGGYQVSFDANKEFE